MEVKFKKSRMIKSLNVEAVSGSFAFDVEPLIWENCRERFGKAWDKSIKGFYLCHEKGEGVNVASFILKTEEILGRKRFTRFAETNRSRILWIEPTIFWRCCRMRRSLFTILVRCGRHFCPPIDYEDALFSEPYTTLTRSAVVRFLFGYTKYVGPSLETTSNVESIGWKAIFYAQNNSFVKSSLIWPERNNPHKLSRRWGQENEFLWS